MLKFMDTVSKESKEAADKFIKRIKNGIITKRRWPNIPKDYPIEKAYESATNLIDSDETKELMKKAYSDKTNKGKME